jgi:hypothetical protein
MPDSTTEVMHRLRMRPSAADQNLGSRNCTFTCHAANKRTRSRRHVKLHDGRVPPVQHFSVSNNADEEGQLSRLCRVKQRSSPKQLAYNVILVKAPVRCPLSTGSAPVTHSVARSSLQPRELFTTLQR